MSSHVTRHPACVETVQVVPTRDEVRITRFVEFQGTNRLACELVEPLHSIGAAVGGHLDRSLGPHVFAGLDVVEHAR